MHTDKPCSPKFTVALIRTPRLSPYHARFLVPLDFSKYDLRDYLYHAYNVKCFNVRSFVKQMPVRDTQAQPRHFFRPDSKKYMTVEMEQPFVWPEIPDLAPWGKAERKKETDASVEASGAADPNKQRDAARVLRKQAEMLLKKQDPEADAAIERKKKAGLALTRSEQHKEDKRIEREARLRKLSALELWEEARTDKIVDSDDVLERPKVNV